MLVPSGITGQGVCSSGEPKALRAGGTGKPIAAQATRRLVLMGRQSLLQNPNTDDLPLGRLKRVERRVEGRKGADVQFVLTTWGLGQKTNLVCG